ncbi:MAG: hypothetical protein DLM50_09560 [Candidatus Meridianibacter frigidus]|nr:MAG: hypothetical protein DLM50_09560 [Candidatus Eremiobacteraeota bacterium]
MVHFRILRRSGAAVFATAMLLAGAAPAKPGPDGALIANSGSTNSPAYAIRVRSDGFAQITGGGSPREARVDGTLAGKLLADARVAKTANPRGGAPCMKSASFGSRTTVLYHGWRSPDLGCPAEGILATLTGDVQAVASALGAGHPGHRVTLPPREPRAVPSDAGGAPIPAPSPRN